VGQILKVSFNGGPFQPATLQTQELKGLGAFASYWMPIPAGTTSVRFTGETYMNVPWGARDASIWTADGSSSSSPPTPDTTGPTISAMQATGVTSSGATITWSTNEAADSQVEYGLTTSYGSSTTVDATRVTSHTVAISGLQATQVYHFRVKSKDGAGNLTTSADGTFRTTATPICPCSIWPLSATPSIPLANDKHPIELGVKLRSDVNGYIAGLRFYKGSGNTGTHVGSLWSSTGTKLASATFTGETASGWQQVTFPTAVPIAANTTYVASYFSPNGGYAATGGMLATRGVDNAPLHALASGVDGPNGVFRYDSTGFPTSTYNGGNYWVDVVFSTTAPSAGASSSSVPASTPTPTQQVSTSTPTKTPTPPSSTPTPTKTAIPPTPSPGAPQR
jgi:hypothetical protein